MKVANKKIAMGILIVLLGLLGYFWFDGGKSYAEKLLKICHQQSDRLSPPECPNISDISWLNEQKIAMLVDMMGGALPKPEKYDERFGVSALYLGEYIPMLSDYVVLTAYHHWRVPETTELYNKKLVNIHNKTEVRPKDLIKKDKLSEIEIIVRDDFDKFFLENKNSGWWGIPQDEQELVQWHNERLSYLLNAPEFRIENNMLMLSYCEGQGSHHVMRHCTYLPAKDYLEF